MAGAGEQFALACTADHEFEQSLIAEVSSASPVERVAAEMAKRALAELEAHFVIAAGHALANVTGRALALDADVRHRLAATKAIRTMSLRYWMRESTGSR